MRRNAGRKSRTEVKLRYRKKYGPNWFRDEKVFARYKAEVGGKKSSPTKPKRKTSKPKRKKAAAKKVKGRLGYNDFRSRVAGMFTQKQLSRHWKAYSTGKKTLAQIKKLAK